MKNTRFKNAQKEYIHLDDCDIISYSTVFKKQGGFKSNKKKKHIKKETQIKGQINLEDMLDDN